MTAPKLRFKEFGGDWELDLLGNLVQIKSGYSPSKYELDKSGEMPFLKVEELNNCDKYQEYSRFYTERNSDAVPSKSVVFPKRGAAILNNKVRILRVDALLDSNLMALIPQHSLDAEYLYYLINKIELYKIADTSTIPQINNKHIEPYSIYLPSKEEQIKIASFLSAVDEKISQLTQKHELLSQYKQGMMQKLFSQQIRFKADDGSEFGEWGNKALNTLCSRSYQGINTVADKVEYQQSGYPILQAKHITSEKLDLVDVRYLSDLDYEKYKEKYIPNVNDILFSNIGTIGKVVLVDAENPFFIAWNIFLITPKETLITPLYLTSYLRWLTALNYFDNLQTGNATKFINKTDLLATVINLPCLAEQTKIANFLSAIDQKIEVVAQQIEQAKTWKKGLLQQMFI